METCSPLQPPNARGFTVVELLVVVAIVGILAAAAIPMFTTFVARNEINAEISALSSSLRLARSESLKRQVPVSVCASTNPNDANPTCATSSTDWATGWIVFSDLATRGQVDTMDTVITRQGALSASGGIVPAQAGGVVTYQPNGLAIGIQTSFTFKAKGDVSNTSLQKVICISAQGSTRIAKVNCQSSS